MFKPRITTLDSIAEDFPDQLYKYRDWTNPNHKTVITKQELFFAPPSSFWTMGDPDDCRFPIAWDFSFEANRPALDKGFPDPVGKTRMSPQEYEFVLRHLHHQRMGTEESQEKAKNDYYDSGASFLGVLSLTGKNDNELIWDSNYAAKGSGFCVGIAFKSCLPELAQASIGGGNVLYVTRDTEPLKYAGASTHTNDEVIQHHMELVHTKYVEFEFEDEYRLTKRFPSQYFNRPIPPPLRLFTVPKYCFRSVTFGYSMTQASIDEIVQACREQDLPVEFFKATLRDDGKVDVLPYTTI